MNYRKERYPKTIAEAISKSNEVLKNLKFKDAPTLGALFSNKDLVRQIPRGAGLYIFIERQKPVYVGISRNIKQRLKQHGWGKICNHATLAYLIAEHEMKYLRKRSSLEHKAVKPFQEKIRRCRVIAIPIPDDDPYLLSFMEIYISGYLKTKWNTFRTH